MPVTQENRQTPRWRKWPYFRLALTGGSEAEFVLEEGRDCAAELVTEARGEWLIELFDHSLSGTWMERIKFAVT